MECTELSQNSPLPYVTSTPLLLSPSAPVSSSFPTTYTSPYAPYVHYPSSSSITSTTLLDKIKSFKPQRKDTLQFSICKKSDCNNRLIIDDGKSLGYCSMMCRLNDWSQPSASTNPTYNNDNISGVESRLDCRVNNRLNGNGLIARSGTNFGLARINKRQPTQ